MDRSTRFAGAIDLELEIRDRMRRLGQDLRACDPTLAGLLEDIAAEADGHARFLEAARGGALAPAAVELYDVGSESPRPSVPDPALVSAPYGT